MSQHPTEALKNHLTLCDEVHQLALEENRFLKQNQRPPDAALLDRKRALLDRLDQSLAALKTANAPAASGISNLKSEISNSSSSRPDPERKAVIEQARAKLLQILHLDRENEQLLLRYSLGARPAPPPPARTAPISQIQKLYDRHG